MRFVISSLLLIASASQASADPVDSSDVQELRKIVALQQAEIASLKAGLGNLTVVDGVLKLKGVDIAAIDSASNKAVWKGAATGLKGDKGDKGDQGIQGIQGIQGNQGSQGTQGIQGVPGTPGANGTTPCGRPIRIHTQAPMNGIPRITYLHLGWQTVAAYADLQQNGTLTLDCL